MTQVEGERGAGYVTAEELIPESPASPLFLGGRAKAEPKRKPTVAALAAQQDDIMQALAALSTQVQSLAKAGLGQPTPAQPIAGAALPPAQAPRQVLATQVSASVMAAQSPPRKFADLLGAPRTRRPADRDCKVRPFCCPSLTGTMCHHERVLDASPFDGVTRFCSEFSFWSWASALPRLVFSTGTAYARFLRISICIPERAPRPMAPPSSRCRFLIFRLLQIRARCLLPRMRSIPANGLPYPNASQEDLSRTTELLKLWGRWDVPPLPCF